MLYIVVVALFASFVSNMMGLYTYYFKRQVAKAKSKHENSGLNIPRVSGSAWELPDGVYQVGVDKAAPNSKDHSSRVWMKKGISGEMIIVAEEHYR